MKARYRGRCAEGDAIEPGDEIVKYGRHSWRHRWHNEPGRHPFLTNGNDRPTFEEAERLGQIDYEARERRMLDQEYAAGQEDAKRERFNRQMFGDAYAAAEEFARDMRGLNGDW